MTKRGVAIGGLLATLLLLSACGPHYPLNIPEEQWLKMDADAQQQARLEQAEVDRARAEARRQEAQAREAEASARAAELSHARATAGPGERVQCVLDRAELHYGGKWRPAEPIGLDLVAGMPIEFELQRQDERYRARRGTARFDGMEIRLCPEYSRSDCARLVATQGELRRGKSRQVTSHDFLRGRLHCEATLGPDHPAWEPRRYY
ncbi:MAG: hypothetical protein ACOCY2_03885 [Guyparkeria sp.]|uniref:hypothetical protein n=1 Tax=Guyparkeria sp. TaxID=2035736 RepID=UPI00397E3F43